MLRVENIFHKYDQELVLQDINLEIEKGTFMTLTGESGSGKSTLLSILSTLLKPHTGEIYFGDTAYQNIKDIDAFRQKHIGFVFQFHYLIDYLTIFENIMIASVSKDKKAANTLLDRMGILNLKDRYASEISGGQRQRAAIARALINMPSILFADEPTGNLDSKNSQMVFEMFQELAKEGMTIIVATHDKTLAQKSDKEVVLHDGIIQ